MIDIGVAKPRAQGQARIRLRTVDRPGGKGRDSNDDDGRDEPACNLVGQALDGSAGALGLRNHLNDLRQHGVAADLFGAHDEAAGTIQRAGDHLAADLLGDGHRFAGNHRLVERGSAFDDLTVDRHLLARPHAKAITWLQHRNLDLLLVHAVRANTTGCPRREVEKSLDRA
jgi:hypothetical protein